MCRNGTPRPGLEHRRGLVHVVGAQHDELGARRLERLGLAQQQVGGVVPPVLELQRPHLARSRRCARAGRRSPGRPRARAPARWRAGSTAPSTPSSSRPASRSSAWPPASRPARPPHQTVGSTGRPKPCLGVARSPTPAACSSSARSPAPARWPRAARALGWTQPAVSQHVRRLEADSRHAAGGPRRAGASRSPRPGASCSATPTRSPTGSRPRRRTSRRSPGCGPGGCGVAAFPTAAAVLLPPVLAGLLARAPGLDLRLDELEPPEAEAAVRDGAADLAVVFRHALRRTPRPRATCSASRSPGTRCWPSSPRAGAARAASPTWPASGGSPAARAAGPTCCAARRTPGFTPDVRFATDDHVVVQRLVAAGLGVALLPSWALEASAQPGRRGVAGARGRRPGGGGPGAPGRPARPGRRGRPRGAARRLHGRPRRAGAVGG